TIVDLDELPDLDDAALEARAEPWERPLWLVCTHGTRDRCCAKWGLPLWSTMQALDPEGVWQSAHLGGHRYAPVALALPVGLQWGRVELEEVPSLLRAVEAGDLAALTGLRGRCCYPRAVQAAEGLLRLEQGLVAGDALRLLAVREDADATEVRFAGPDGVALTIVVEQVDRPDLAGPASCGDQPTSRQVFRRRHG
ncbi:MAG: hypothetical protein KC457_24680, partial [Myxococcales bacterium]|nr:hypothetical protein [Myxococcales bacterium]